MDLFNAKIRIFYDLYDRKLSEPIHFLNEIFNKARFEVFLLEVLIIASIIALINSIIAFGICKKKLDGFIVFFINIIMKFSTILLIRLLFQMLNINKHLGEICWFTQDSIGVNMVAIGGFLLIAILFTADMIIEGALYRRFFIKGEKDGWEISKICNAISNVIVILSPIIVNHCIQSIVFPSDRIASVLFVYVNNFYFKDGLKLILEEMKLVVLLSFVFAIVAKLFRMKNKDVCTFFFVSLIVNTIIMSSSILLDGYIEISKIFVPKYSDVANKIYLYLMIASVFFCSLFAEEAVSKKIIKKSSQKIPIILTISNILSLVIIIAIQLIKRN